MAWNIFKKDKDKNDLEDNSFEKKIDEALRNAQNDKRDAKKDIENIKSWAAEIIIETYADTFPNGHLTYYREKYKADALEKYEQIKKDNAGKIPADKVEKCDRLLKGYLNQIGLRESKMKLYDKLEKQYLDTKAKLKKLDVDKVVDDKINTHEERLRMLDSDTNTYVDAMSDTAKMKELQNEFELKSEYINQLNALSEKYDTQNNDDATYTNSGAFKEELDKMLDDMD